MVDHSLLKAKEKNPYFATCICLYLNYLALGIGLITVAQNMNSLMVRFNTNEAGIAGVISGIGAGRLLSYFIQGYLSDKYGRKPLVCTGVFLYIVSLLGILFSPNIYVAFCFSMLGGVGNAALDTGTYPALMEVYPRVSGTAVTFCKAAVSIGQMSFPLVVSALIVYDIWYGYSFFVPVGIFIIGGICLRTKKFPSHLAHDKVSAENINLMPRMRRQPKWYDCLASILFSYAAYAVFYSIVVWIPKYAEKVVGMDVVSALQTVSYYSVGSLLSVFAVAYLVRRLVRPVLITTLFPLCAGLCDLVVYFYPIELVCNAGSFLIGFFAAGGILQLGVSIVAEFYPHCKAKMTGAYMMFGSLANFTVPLITGMLSNIDISLILIFAASAGFVGSALGGFVYFRYYRIFEIPDSDLRFAEGKMR